LILVDTYGRATAYLNPVLESLTTRYRIGQYDTFRDPAKRDYLSRQIVKVKLQSQIDFLRSTNKLELKDGISRIESIKNQTSENSIPISIENKAAHNGLQFD
jgi:CRISP-associated protein Cas1